MILRVLRKKLRVDSGNSDVGFLREKLSGFLFDSSHRAMFKLGGKKLFVLCLLVKNESAVNSTDR